MITFTKLGRDGGNFGNQLHQVASLIGFSEKYGCELVLPKWRWAGYFSNPPRQGNAAPEMMVEEIHFHYTPEYWDAFKESYRKQTVDIWGWLQCEKYWDHCRNKVFAAFTFKREIVDKVKTGFSRPFEKKVIAISIRRGDFITNPNHFLLPLDYYLKALINFFPGYKDLNIIIFSDDPEYCSFHIRHLNNIFFATKLNPGEQLCLMSLCDHFIISNSTFSWWGAMLGEKPHSVIIRPAYHFDGEYLKKFDWKDYYPERWKKYDHKNDVIDVSVLLRSAAVTNYLLMLSKCGTFFKRSIGRMNAKFDRFFNRRIVEKNELYIKDKGNAL